MEKGNSLDEDIESMFNSFREEVIDKIANVKWVKHLGFYNEMLVISKEGNLVVKIYEDGDLDHDSIEIDIRSSILNDIESAIVDFRIEPSNDTSNCINQFLSIASEMDKIASDIREKLSPYLGLIEKSNQ